MTVLVFRNKKVFCVSLKSQCEFGGTNSRTSIHNLFTSEEDLQAKDKDWRGSLIKVMDSCLGGRQFRAARIKNFMRGLPIEKLDKPDVAGIASLYLDIRRRTSRSGGINVNDGAFRETLLGKISAEFVIGKRVLYFVEYDKKLKEPA